MPYVEWWPFKTVLSLPLQWYLFLYYKRLKALAQLIRYSLRYFYVVIHLVIFFFFFTRNVLFLDSHIEILPIPQESNQSLPPPGSLPKFFPVGIYVKINKAFQSFFFHTIYHNLSFFFFLTY